MTLVRKVAGSTLAPATACVPVIEPAPGAGVAIGTAELDCIGDEMMMKRYLMLLCLFAFVLVGCKKTEEAVGGDATAPEQTTTTGEIAGTASPSDLNPVAAQAYIDDVTIGHEVGADGTIPAGHTGDDFKPGDPIHVAMKVKDAPAGAAVKVVWIGPNETKVGEEQKDVPSGATTLSFTASDTAKWTKGDYRAEVWIGDEKVNTQQFQIVDAAKSGK